MTFLRNLFFGSRGVSLIRECIMAGDSHVGRVRSLNEDSYLFINDPENDAVLLGVADGMGGHEGGEVASYLVTRYLLAEWNRNGHDEFQSKNSIRSFLDRGLSRANNHIYQVNHKLNIRWKMGTTCTIGVIWRNRLIVAQIGDSRAYRMRNGIIRQLTTDHNWMNEMIANGGMTPEEAEAHPLAHTLTNCVGTFESLRIDFSEHAIASGDRYLFCSDGLSSYVDVEELSEHLNTAETPSASVKRLLHLSLTNSGADNITAVCAFL